MPLLTVATLRTVMQRLEDISERMAKEDEGIFRQLLRRTRAAGIVDFPSSLRSKPSAEQFLEAVREAEKQEIDTFAAQSRFADAFKGETNLRVADVNETNVEGLSESQAKKALLIACKIASDVSQLCHRQTTLCAAFNDLSVHRTAQVSKLMEELHAFVDDYDKLKGEQDDAAKCYADSEAKLRQEASTASGSSSRKLAALARHIEAAASNDAQLQERVDELKEKLRCSICMDRQKDTVFACGHTCCKECAGEWKRCYYNCKSKRSQKPQGSAFPLYL